MSNLTDKQQETIESEAIRMMYEDCMNDDSYTFMLLENYVEMHKELGGTAWELISNEADWAADILGFDPVTGETRELEEADE